MSSSSLHSLEVIFNIVFREDSGSYLGTATLAFYNIVFHCSCSLKLIFSPEVPSLTYRLPPLVTMLWPEISIGGPIYTEAKNMCCNFVKDDKLFWCISTKDLLMKFIIRIIYNYHLTLIAVCTINNNKRIGLINSLCSLDQSEDRNLLSCSAQPAHGPMHACDTTHNVHSRYIHACAFWGLARNWSVLIQNLQYTMYS